MQKNEPNSAEWHIDPKTGELIDPDEAPELDEQWFAEADLYDGDKLVRRGRPPSPHSKRLVSLRLSPEVLDHFQSGGPGWQTRINDALLGLIGEICKGKRANEKKA